MEKLRIFSKKINAYITFVVGQDNCDAVKMDITTWTDSGWNDTKEGWMDNNWNDNGGWHWTDQGWNNNTDDSWVDKGWSNDTNDSWLDRGWNNW